MQPRSDGERLAVLETQLQSLQQTTTSINTDIKVLGSQMERFLSQNIEKDSRLRGEIAMLQQSVARMERKNGFWAWMMPTLSAIAGSILSFLFISYLQHLH